jgi:PTS system fructose-specific IIA component
MQLLDILHEGVVLLGLQARDRAEAIERLLDKIVESGGLAAPDREAVLEAVLRREAQRTTGLGLGVAVPHGVSDACPEVVGALGIAPAGVDFAAVDGQPSRIIILLVTPRNRFQAHVSTMAGIARLLNRRALRERLLTARTAREVVDALAREEEIR